MNVPAGYKQTEVGVIPEDWDVNRIGDVGVVGSGGTPRREIDSYWNGDIPWITTSQIDFGAINEARQFITEDGLRNSAANLLPSGTLLMALYGQGKTRGKVGILRIEAATNQACASIGIHKNTSGEFVFYFLASKYKELRNLSNSGSQDNLSGKIVKEIKIVIPPLSEQQAIATALSDTDALIESLAQLIAKKRQIKQGAMQELLTGQRRLPGFSGEWMVKRLGELADMGSGGTPPSSNPIFYDGEIPWIAISDMTKGGKFIHFTERNLSREGFDNCAAQMFPAGTVLYAMYASLGECSIASVPLCSSQAILGIRVNEKLSSEFLYYYLQFIKPKVKTLGQQGTQANLNKGMVQDFAFQLPPVIEQTAIATVLSDMDTELAALQNRLTKARHIKQGMMQELLTGRIRLL